MSKLITLTLGVGVAVASAMLWIQVGPGERGVDSEQSEAADPIGDATPVRVSERVPPPLSPPTIGVAQEAPIEPFAPPSSESDQAALIDEQRQQRERSRGRILSAFAEEARDSSWASAVESDIRDSMNLVADGASLESVECRSTLCALVINHPHRDAQTESMSTLAGAPGFRLAGRAHLESDSTATVTHVFLHRGGDRFPDY